MFKGEKINSKVFADLFELVVNNMGFHEINIKFTNTGLKIQSQKQDVVGFDTFIPSDKFKNYKLRDEFWITADIDRFYLFSNDKIDVYCDFDIIKFSSKRQSLKFPTRQFDESKEILLSPYGATVLVEFKELKKILDVLGDEVTFRVEEKGTLIEDGKARYLLYSSKNKRMQSKFDNNLLKQLIKNFNGTGIMWIGDNSPLAIEYKTKDLDIYFYLAPKK